MITFDVNELYEYIFSLDSEYQGMLEDIYK